MHQPVGYLSAAHCSRVCVLPSASLAGGFILGKYWKSEGGPLPPQTSVLWLLLVLPMYLRDIPRKPVDPLGGEGVILRVSRERKRLPSSQIPKPSVASRDLGYEKGSCWSKGSSGGWDACPVQLREDKNTSHLTHLPTLPRPHPPSGHRAGRFRRDYNTSSYFVCLFLTSCASFFLFYYTFSRIFMLSYLKATLCCFIPFHSFVCLCIDFIIEMFPFFLSLPYVFFLHPTILVVSEVLTLFWCFSKYLF